MKRETVKKLLCVYIVAASLCMPSTAVFAEAEATAAEATAAESAQEAPAEDTAQPAEGEDSENTEEKEIRDVIFTVNGADILIGNRTERNYDKIAVVLKEIPAEGQPVEPVELIFADETGTEHTFADVEPQKWTDAILTEDLGFLYIQCRDETGTDQEIPEKGMEKDLEEKVPIHVTASVNVRSEASVDSQALQGAAQGTAFTAVGSAPGWVKVEIPGTDSFGYISHKFVSVDGSDAENVSTGNSETVQSSGTTAQSSTSGSGNSGSGNTSSGNNRSGNSGSSNSGNTNSGNSNSGNTNSGNSNSGNTNSGNSNSGNTNSGNSNSENTNSGNTDSGNSNTDNSNTGNNSSGGSLSGTESGTENFADTDIPGLDIGGDTGDNSPSGTEPEAEVGVEAAEGSESSAE